MPEDADYADRYADWHREKYPELCQEYGVEFDVTPTSNDWAEVD